MAVETEIISSQEKPTTAQVCQQTCAGIYDYFQDNHCYSVSWTAIHEQVSNLANPATVLDYVGVFAVRRILTQIRPFTLPPQPPETTSKPLNQVPVDKNSLPRRLRNAALGLPLLNRVLS